VSDQKAKSKVAENIKKYARKQNLPINSLADFAGVSRSQLYDVLAGKKSPTVAWLEKIAQALEVDVQNLVK
jgi:transcriptional regulator with XRE-family HTH domain